MLKILIVLKVFIISIMMSYGQLAKSVRLEPDNTKSDTTYSVMFILHNLNSLNIDLDTISVFLSGAAIDGNSGIGSHSPWPVPLEDSGLELLDSDGDLVYTLTLSNIIPGDYQYKYGIVSSNNGTLPNWNFPIPSPVDTLVFTVVDQNVTIEDILPPSSISSIDNSLDFTIYPNPSNGVFTIDIDKPSELTITNMAGKVIMKRKLNNNDVIDLSNQGQGLFSITAKANNKTKTVLMVVK